MKKYVFLLAISLCFLVWSSCNDDACAIKIHESTLVIDMTDSTIVEQFKREENLVISTLVPSKINRCEQIKMDVFPIGSSIENQSCTISYPASGIIDKGIGEYALEDSNEAKQGYIVQHITEAVNSFTSVGQNESQIFYTINQVLHHKSGRCVIYTDLLERYGQKFSFYKTGYNFESTLKNLIYIYGIDTITKTSFNGKLTIITPMGKHQDQVLYARSFYRHYFSTIGLTDTQYEFVGSISQSKF